MSELREKLKSEVDRILAEPLPEPSEPIRLETEEVFDAELLHNPGPDPFSDDPMKILGKMMTDLKDMTMRPSLGILPDMPSLDHKVKIFWLHRSLKIEEVEQIEMMIEALLSDGWRCHLPLVCSDFLIMDFSRRKEIEECQST